MLRLQNPEKRQSAGYMMLCASDNSICQQVIASLTQAGISLQSSKEFFYPFLIVFLDNTTQEGHLKSLTQSYYQQGCRVILLNCGQQSLPFRTTQEVVESGAAEVLDVGLDFALVKVVGCRLERWQIIERLVKTEGVSNVAIGKSYIWIHLLRKLVEAACFSNISLLLTGESGTGKELLAHLIHELDKRPTKEALVILDCTTIVPELSGSEFYGHEKGAFTNAVSTREGAFALADQGTLFLDEVGELPLPLQAGLLRVIQEGNYKKVGSNQWKKTSFRLVCATNRDLPEEVRKGHFRQDLYYRIAGMTLQLPPLRDRKDDIVTLSHHFLKGFLKTESLPAFDKQVFHYLQSYNYPGNIRELKLILQRMAACHTPNIPFTIANLVFSISNEMKRQHNNCENNIQTAIHQSLMDGMGLKDIKKLAASIAMDIAIEEAEGNLQVAASRLGVTDRTLQFHQVNRKIA